jgi:large subunit ribosomal protein L3
MSTIGILGKKLGMTQVFTEEGKRLPVTVIEAGPCTVLQVKSSDGVDQYNAVQLGFDDRRKSTITRPMQGHFAKAESAPKRFVREFRLEEGETFEAGSAVTVDSFEGVKKVDVQGLSKGKGFAGWMKRWNFAGQRASHGNSVSHRRPGSIGRTYSTAKGVPKGKKMAGQLGNETITVQGLQLVSIDSDRNLIIIKGAVPGPNGGYLKIRKSILDRG